MSCRMKFEDLPNEILLQCLEYLNVLHLFHSFDELNDRFSRLIRSLKLHFNLVQVSPSICQEFRTKAREDPSIKQQVVSMDLSDERSLDESDWYLSNYAVDEFSHLKYLSLTQIKPENATKFVLGLSSMSQLRYLTLHIDEAYHYSDSSSDLFHLLTETFIEQLKYLNTSKLPTNITNPREIVWLLEHLTIKTLTSEQVRKIFQYCPHLKRMEIESWSADYQYPISHAASERFCAMNLEKLIIRECGTFKSLESLFILTPSLKDFSFIMKDDGLVWIDGAQWERLISSHLPNLIRFQLYLFDYLYAGYKTNALQLGLKGFQTTFWQEKKSWPIAYELTSSSSILVYSIPYPSKTYRLSPTSERYYPPSINPKTIFANVTSLSILDSMIDSLSLYSFPRVECLALVKDFRFNRIQRSSLELISIEKLNENLSLSKIKELDIDSSQNFQSVSVLMQLLNATSYLSTLRIDSYLFDKLSAIDKQFALLIKEKVKNLILGQVESCMFNTELLNDSSDSPLESDDSFPSSDSFDVSD